MIPIRNAIGGVGNLMFKQAYLYAQVRKGSIPDVYVQSPKYWDGVEDEIRMMFGDGIEPIDRVSLQIRRGDYLDKSDIYIQLSETEYYKKAVEYFPNEKFLVFCYDRQDARKDKTDREWCREYLNNLIPDRWDFWEPQSETDDLNAMAGCKSNIMANGTFSWWAAFLNPNPDKKVICPATWFQDGIQRCELLDSWIKI